MKSKHTSAGRDEVPSSMPLSSPYSTARMLAPSELEELRQVQNEGLALMQKEFPNAKIRTAASSAEMNDHFKFPDPVRAKVLELIQRDDARSVSCPFDDPD